MDHHILKHRILLSGKKHCDAKQIHKRLRALYPARVQNLIDHYKLRGKFSVAKATRKAHLDTRLKGYIDEITDISHEAHREKIAWETQTMLFNARQSIDSFHRSH